MRKWSTLFLVLLCLTLTACGKAERSQEENAYIQARTLFEQGDYDGAKAAFTALGDYQDSRYILSEIKMAQAYEEAKALLEAEDYPRAYTALCALSGYKDVDAYLARFQTVSITRDNWADYFEIIEIPTSTKNTAGEYERLHISYIFKIKDNVWSQVYDFYANEIQGTIDYMWQMKNLVMNKETGEYTLNSFESYIEDMLYDQMLTVAMEGAEQQKEIGEAITVTGEDIDGSTYCWIDIWLNFSIREIEGKLYLYQ